MTGSSFRDACAFCGSRSLEPIIDFGDVALAGGFLKPAQFETEPRYRLRVVFCTDCLALQLPDVVDPAPLFANYFYFSSAIRSLREHFLDYASEVVARFLRPEHATVVEIGCNDGILLKPLADQGVRTPIGVDPATNIVQSIGDPRITIVNDFFGSAVAARIRDKHGAADLIVANNVYAHIPDINDVTKGVAELLAPNGVFVFEVHHLGSVLRGLQYDMIYHEHLYYYSLLALENHLRRHGLKVFDVKRIPIHAGSMRYYVCRAGQPLGKERDQPRRAPAAGRARAGPRPRRDVPALRRRDRAAQGHLGADTSSGCAKRAGASPATAPQDAPTRSSSTAASAASTWST